MWRATVIERITDGQVVVSISSLFRGDPVGPMQSAVDAQVGDAVIVADLRADAKVRDWWVLGYESQIGRWGSPYPHEHPMGQVIGLVDALAGKADVGTGGSGSSAWEDITGKPTTFPPSTHAHAQSDVTGLPEIASAVSAATYLPTPGTIPRRADNGGFRVVTGSNVQDAVNVEHVSTNYVSKTSYNTGMGAKADAPGDWVDCIPSTYITKESGADIQVRTTPGGIQIRSGRWRYASNVPRDATIFTLPAGYRPTTGTLFVVSGMSAPANNYDAIMVHFEARSTGVVVARSAHTAAPLITLNETIFF